MTDPRVVMERMLQRGVVRMFLNPTHFGVVVPAALQNSPALALNFSHRFAPFDLALNDVEVKATLSFGGQPFEVRVPWRAVSALMSPPMDEFVQFEPEGDGPTFKRAAGDFQPAPAAKFKLSVVPDEPGVTKTYSPPRTGHLRLLKN